MPSPGPALSYTSYDGATLTLYPWSGRQVAVLTASDSLDPNVMDKLLDGLDRAFDVYAYITSREPSLFRQYDGLLSIAQVPTTFGSNGGALGWLGSTGIELSEMVWTRLYDGIEQSGQFDQAVFYELGRNFWFYEAQLGTVDPFVTGFAIVNRFISMEQARLPGAPFNGTLDFAEFKVSILEDLSRTFLSNSAYTLANTIVANSGVTSPYNWGSADLAASLLYQVYEDLGLEEYRAFYSALAGLPGASDSAAAIDNFLDAAQMATGIDYSFLNKAAGTSYVTGGRGDDTVNARNDGTPAFGFGGDDTLTGTSGGDRLFGDNGDDMLLGGAGNDELVAGQGADLVRGGGGADKLSGGAGNDTFRDTAGEMKGDTITDFSLGDRIVFSDANLASFTFSLSGLTLNYNGGSLTLGRAPSGSLVLSADPAGGVQLTFKRPELAQNDFNGDGRSDVLWRHESGTLTNWVGQPNGGFLGNNAQLFMSVDLNWHSVGTGDFNGDGRADVLWRHTSGWVTDWLGQASGGFIFNNSNAFANVGTDWTVAGVGDFNRDGNDDILWRHDSGLVTNWLGEDDGGFASNFANAAANVATSWQVAATGDFDGDGNDDILWRHNSGLITTWLGEDDGGFGDNFANAAANVATTWHIVGTGDFDGDGNDDILWQHDSGLVANWLGEDDGGFAANNALNQVSLDWSVAGIGDYDGDGHDDLLWRHDSGLVTNWLGTGNGGFGDNSANAATMVAAQWGIESPGLV